MAISTKLLRAMTTKGWSEYCMVEKKAITTLADELDALRAPKARTGEVQYQARLRDPHLPECNVWMNITEAGANSIREKHSHVYEVRELVERHATPKVGDLLEEKLKSMQQERFQAIDAAFVKSLAEQKPVAILHDDGHYTWHGDKPHDFNYAGWRMEVYAVPQTAKLEPLAWINPYALKCLQGNATAVCAPKGMREDRNRPTTYLTWLITHCWRLGTSRLMKLSWPSNRSCVLLRAGQERQQGLSNSSHFYSERRKIPAPTFT
jgi:hypothetical protein